MKNTSMKQVKHSKAIKKADCATPAIFSFNEHLESQSKGQAALPAFAPIVCQDVNEMPSNRQGETVMETTEIISPDNQRQDTEQSKMTNNFFIQTQDESAAEQLFEESKMPRALASLGTTHQQSEDLQDKNEREKELEKIKKEHLIQTLQSLQYLKTVEKPAKAQIILKSFNMPNQKPEAAAVSSLSVLSPAYKQASSIIGKQAWMN